MFQIRNPVAGCIVFATKWHPKLMNGARIGFCKEVLDGVILVQEGDRRFAVFTSIKGKQFHDFWNESDSKEGPDSILLKEFVEIKYNGDIGCFASQHKFSTQSATQWCRGGWILFNKKIYSPQFRHNEWVSGLNLSEKTPVILSYVVDNYYSGQIKLFAKQNKLILSSSRSWLRENWLISHGTIYRPQKSI